MDKFNLILSKFNLNFKEENTEVIIENLFKGGLFFITSKACTFLVALGIQSYFITMLFWALALIIEIISKIILLTVICSILYKLLKFFDITIKRRND